MISLSVLWYLFQGSLISLYGFEKYGHTLLFRAGYDQNTSVYNVVDAIISPNSRAYTRPFTLFWAALAIFGLFALIAFLRSEFKTLRVSLFVFVGTYFLYAALLPNSVSIHPYIYDEYFVVPALFFVVFMASRKEFADSRLRTLYPWMILLFLGIVNYNLIHIYISGK